MLAVVVTLFLISYGFRSIVHIVFTGIQIVADILTMFSRVREHSFQLAWLLQAHLIAIDAFNHSIAIDKIKQNAGF